MDFIDHIKQLPEFANCNTLQEFEQLFTSIFKKKCNKCKKSKYKTDFSLKANGNEYKLCPECRNIMKDIMRAKK